jgi:hypothetical protein
MNTKSMFIVAAMAVMLIGATAVAATDNAIADGKKKYDKNQATSLANVCGNDKLPMSVFCQNIDSQVQGDDNAVAIDGVQRSGEDHKDKKDSTPKILLSADLAKLGAKWWKWVLEIPKPMNPLFDANPCDVNQHGDFFFLAGVFETSGHIERTCTIPEGKAIFFPVYNTFQTYGDLPNGDPDPDSPDNLEGAIEVVRGNVDQATNLKASVDGTNINVNKLRSLTIPFEFTLPPDNIYGLTDPLLGPWEAVADGYWVALRPLSVGNHEISFSASQPSLNVDVTYHIAVQ